MFTGFQDENTQETLTTKRDENAQETLTKARLKRLGLSKIANRTSSRHGKT